MEVVTVMRAISRTWPALAIVALAIACEATGSTDPKLTFAKLSLDKKAVTLLVDDDYQLSIASNPDGSPVTWQSLDPNVAVVSTSGLVSGRGIGTAKVVAAAKRSTDTATISVHAPLANIVVTPDSLTLGWGKSSSLYYRGTDKNGQTVSDLGNSSMKWSSTAQSIVTVTGDGVVRGIASGNAWIKLTVNGKSDSTFVHVDPAPIASVTINPSPTASLGNGRSLQLGSIVKDSSGAQQTKTPVWSSSDSTVAVVSSNGVVTAKRLGTAVVSANVAGVAGSTSINVVPPLIVSVAVALNSSSLQAGQTTQAVATSKDSTGTVVTGRQVVWSTKNPAVATISTLGLVSAVAPGTTDVVATVDGVAAAATITVSAATVSSVGVVLGSSSIVVGATTQATATAADLLGNPITGRPVTWSTSSSATATVSSLGVVTAVAGGTVSITASVDGVVGSATLVITKPTVASISVTPSTASVNAGATLQASAVVLDASGVTITTPPTWISSSPTVATVSANGLITGVASGTTTITATEGGKATSIPVTVQGTLTAPSSPSPAGHIALGIQRFDGGSGTVLVSNGIPLAPGMLTPASLANVQLFVGGVEQSIYVEALSGRHPDGSLRSILVQFNANVASGVTLSGELVLGQPSTRSPLAKPTASRSVPAAAALPTDPKYLITTGFVLPTNTAADNRARGADFAKYEDDYAQWADYHWTREGTSWGDNFYDRVAAYYGMWVRTGNPVYWNRATQLSNAYRHDYVEYQNYQISTYVIATQGIMLHYLATGEPLSFFAVGRIAQQFARCVNTSTENSSCYMAPLTYNQDLRNPTRMLEAFLWAWLLQSPGDPAMGSFDWASLLSKGTDLMLSTQLPNGGYSSQEYCYGIPPYQIGLFNDQLIRQYLLFKADPRIVTSVTNSVQWMWSTQWVASASAFHYNSVDCPDNGLGTSVGGTEPAGDLTGMLVDGFAWSAKMTGDPNMASIARQVFSAAISGAYLIGSKQFNQEYMSSMVALPNITP